MSDFDVDLFVLGAGSGGVRAARIAAGHGAKVAVAEEFRTGGTCVIRGCVPKKIMVLASRFHDAFDDAAGYGWTLHTPPEFSWPTLVAAKDREIGRLSTLYTQNLERSGVKQYDSRAVLEDAHTVRLLADGTLVRAKNILIATGGHPVAPHIPGAELAISSNEAFDLKTLPKRILIVGGGYVALEFACMFHRLGSQVTLVHRGEKVLRGFDEDLRDELMLALAGEGITLKMNNTVAKIEEAHDSCRKATYISGDDDEFDVVFFATGRTPNTSGLGLEKAGVALEEWGGVKVDASGRTNVPHIFAVGDVTDRINLTPVAIREGHAVADMLFGERKWTPDHSLVATAVFSTPEIGTIGMTEHEARERLMPIDIYRAKFRSLKHTLTRRQEKTFMKLVVDAKSDKVIGVHIMGEDAGEMIQLAAVAVGMGATKADFDRTVAVHPSAAEELVTMRDKVHVPNPGGAI
jgi:glutathione reductase (NADPH)